MHERIATNWNVEKTTMDPYRLKATQLLTIKYADQLNSVDGETYQSLLSQPSVGQFGLIKWAG